MSVVIHHFIIEATSYCCVLSVHCNYSHCDQLSCIFKYWWMSQQDENKNRLMTSNTISEPDTRMHSLECLLCHHWHSVFPEVTRLFPLNQVVLLLWRPLRRHSWRTMVPTARCLTGWTFRSRRQHNSDATSAICQIQTQTLCVCVCMCACARRVISDDDFDETRKGASDDELFEPYSHTRWLKLFLLFNNQLKVHYVKFLRKPFFFFFTIWAFSLKKGLP